MDLAYANKLIDKDDSGVERSLTLAIRKAASVGDSGQLAGLAESVLQLSHAATKARDGKLMSCVGRLLTELRAANGGPQTYRPMLEYKDCAAPLSLNRRSKQTNLKSGSMNVEGYGSTFGGEPDSYNDIIEKGAFTKSLARHRAAGTLPKLFWAHDPRQVLGRWDEMYEDSHGLVTIGKLADTQLGRETNELIEMRAVDGESIGFMIPVGGARFDSKGIRYISEIDLFEVSVVSLPANPNAQLNGAAAPRGTSDVLDALANARRVLEGTKDNNVIDFSAALRNLSRRIETILRN